MEDVERSEFGPMTDFEKVQLADIVLRYANNVEQKTFAERLEKYRNEKFAGDLWPRAIADALLEVADHVIDRSRGARGWQTE